MSGRPRISAQRFTISGIMRPLSKSTTATMLDWTPTRPVGGWLATYGKINDEGHVVPTKDRDGHIFEAARELGRVRFATYLERGKFNDNHKTGITVGFPTLLEHHDEESPLALAHRKVGYWTEGYLLDRNDPNTWEARGYEPTEEDFSRADYYWRLSRLLKGTTRGLALSAHGQYAQSPCGNRITWADIHEAAVCEVPRNPDTVLMPLELGTPLRIGAEGIGVAGADPCATCSCPANACRKLVLAKGTKATVDTVEIAPHEERDVERLARLLCARMGCTTEEAMRWIRMWLREQKTRKEATNADR